MFSLIAFLDFVLWSSVAAVVIATIGYPIVLLFTAPIVRSRKIFDGAEPTVSLIIAAYNEESVIGEKLENSLALDYPATKLEIIVASDGSTDLTNSIVTSYASRGIILKSFPRTGKTGMQNQVASQATAEVLVFSDANAAYQPDAIRKLVRNFSDPDVGGVCGQLEYRVESAGAGHSENMYWRYEKFIKRRESELSSVVGANGSIYAVRRTDYVQLDDDMISDFVEPLALVRSGKRVVYEPQAVSVEAASASYGTEYRRKVRILTRSIRGLIRMRQMLNPLRFGIFAIQLIMHKLLRFLTPAFLIAGMLALTGLAILGKLQALFLIAVFVIGIGTIIASRRPSRTPNLLIRASHLLYYYILANYALLLAWRNVLRGDRMTLWAPERSDVNQ